MKRTRISRGASFLLALSLAFSLCAPAAFAEETGTGDETEKKPLIELNYQELIMEVGDEQSLTATINEPDTEETPEGKAEEKIEWSVIGDTDVLNLEHLATDTIVNIQAEKRTDTRTNPVKVRATYKKETAECTVIVYPVVKTLSIDPMSLNVDAGKTETLALTVEMQEKNEDVPEIIWKSSDEKVAVVTPQEDDKKNKTSARVTVLSKDGAAQITASCGAKKATCYVGSGNAVTGITNLTPLSAPLTIGTPLQLQCSVMPGNAGNKAINWSSGDTSVVTVDKTGRLTPVGPGKTTVTAAAAENEEFKTSCEVEVSGLKLTDPASSSLTVAINKSYTLVVQAFGKAKEYQNNITWYSANTSLVNVNSKSGRVMGLGYTASPVRVTAQAGTSPYTVYCDVSVAENTATVINAGSLEAGEQLKFSGDIMSALASRCREELKDEDGKTQNLTYVTSLSVPTNQGILYYGYTSADEPGYGVGATEKYYYSPGNGQRDLSAITFVPKADFTGTARINYIGFGSGTDSFSGTINVQVNGATDVNYTTAEETAFNFSSAAFTSICRQKGGREVSYITLNELPKSNQGTLYRNYSGYTNTGEKAETGTQYYRTRSPKIDDLTFVPAAGFSGTIRLAYISRDAGGQDFRGTLTIIVTKRNGSEENDTNVRYNIGRNVNQVLRASDFNTACRNAKKNTTLSHIRFTNLPTTSQGILYLNYSTNYTGSNYNQRVATNTPYYYNNSTPHIGNITFVPASNYSGTLTIPYTGYDTDGDSFTGNLMIAVGESTTQTISYRSVNGAPVTLEAADFNSACRSVTGSDLNYVRFDLPSSAQGNLYYGYNTSTGTYSNTVSSSTNYYRNGGNRLSNVTFVPATGYIGTILISYTGWSTAAGNTTFTGTLSIEVTQPRATTIRYTVSGAPQALRTSDFNNACKAVYGQDLSYIQFTSLPSNSTGTLYVNYAAGKSNTAVNTGTRCYTTGTPNPDQISFVPRAGYQGTVSVEYTGYDKANDRYTGTVEFIVSTANVTSHFSDLNGYDWAKGSIVYLYDQGVVTGTTASTFAPGQTIRRGDFILMLSRAFKFQTSGGKGFSDVPSDSYYAAAISGAQALGIAQGDGGRFMPNGDLTREQAMVLITRSMTASGRSVPNVAASALNNYPDAGRLSSYARDSAASLVYLGIINGDGYGNLNPHALISRAEMAVILHRVMTL